MQIITLQAHFDGKQILLDEPYELAPNTKLVVSVIQTQNEGREDWTRFLWQTWNALTEMMNRNTLYT